MTAQSRAPAILLTRPQAQSARFAGLLLARHPGLDCVLSPLIEAEFLMPPLPPRPAAALILTSETGAEAARRILAQGGNLPLLAFCVGDRTAQAARQAGFEALSAGGDAQALLGMIRAREPDPPLVHIHGRETRGDIVETLNSAGLETFSVPAYAQNPQPLNAAALQLLQADRPVIAPVFSPRSAALLGAECTRIAARAPITLVAISAAAAQAFPTVPARIAARPDANAMLEAVSFHLETLNLPPSRH